MRASRCLRNACVAMYTWWIRPLSLKSPLHEVAAALSTTLNSLQVLFSFTNSHVAKIYLMETDCLSQLERIISRISTLLMMWLNHHLVWPRCPNPIGLSVRDRLKTDPGYRTRLRPNWTGAKPYYYWLGFPCS